MLNPEKQNLTLVELADQEFLYSIYENISSSEVVYLLSIFIESLKFLDLSFESQISIIILSLATVIGISANIYVLVTVRKAKESKIVSSRRWQVASMEELNHHRL